MATSNYTEAGQVLAAEQRAPTHENVAPRHEEMGEEALVRCIVRCVLCDC